MKNWIINMSNEDVCESCGYKGYCFITKYGIICDGCWESFLQEDNE